MPSVNTSSRRKRIIRKEEVLRVAAKRTYFRNIRRAFRGFSTEEAWTFVVRHKGKRRFCRVHRKQNAHYLAERYLDVLTLFHKLYPKNSLTPVGVMRVPGKAIIGAYPEEFNIESDITGDWRKTLERQRDNDVRGLLRFPVWGVVTEIERKQSADFKKYQHDVRARADSDVWFKATEQHIKFIEKTGIPIGNRIFRESGISVVTNGNISNVNGKPLYFEPKITAPRRLFALIQTKPAKERQALLRITQRLGLVQPK